MQPLSPPPLSLPLQNQYSLNLWLSMEHKTYMELPKGYLYSIPWYYVHWNTFYLQFSFHAWDQSASDLELFRSQTSWRLAWAHDTCFSCLSIHTVVGEEVTDNILINNIQE